MLTLPHKASDLIQRRLDLPLSFVKHIKIVSDRGDNSMSVVEKKLQVAGYKLQVEGCS